MSLLEKLLTALDPGKARDPAELYISYKLHQFPLTILEDLKQFVHQFYGKVLITKQDREVIISLLRHDKKNNLGKTLFVLLKAPEHPIIDCEVSPELIEESISYYLN